MLVRGGHNPEFGAPWTEAEDAVLREHYPAGAIAVHALLPHRTRIAIAQRAFSLRIVRSPHWEPEEDAELIELWADGTRIEVIAKDLGRPVLGVWLRARHLGLRSGCPDGFEYLWHSAQRCGFENLASFRKLLRDHGVPVKIALGKTRGKYWRRHIVDIIEVDAAVAEWSQTETVAEAAARIGVSGRALRHWLRLDGVTNTGPKTRLRVTEAQVQRALRHRKIVRGVRQKEGA